MRKLLPIVLLCLAAGPAANELPEDVKSLPQGDRTPWKRVADALRDRLAQTPEGVVQLSPGMRQYFADADKNLEQHIKSTREQLSIQRRNDPSYVKGTKQRLDELERKSADAKREGRRVVYPSYVGNQIGQAGSLGATITQIVDPATAIVRQANTESTIWVEGIDTSKLVDGNFVPDGYVVEVVGTKAFGSVSGAKTTVLKAVVIDAAKLSTPPTYNELFSALRAKGINPLRIAEKLPATGEQESYFDELAGKIGDAK